MGLSSSPGMNSKFAELVDLVSDAGLGDQADALLTSLLPAEMPVFAIDLILDVSASLIVSFSLPIGCVIPIPLFDSSRVVLGESARIVVHLEKSAVSLSVQNVQVELMMSVPFLTTTDGSNEIGIITTVGAAYDFISGWSFSGLDCFSIQPLKIAFLDATLQVNGIQAWTGPSAPPAGWNCGATFLGVHAQSAAAEFGSLVQELGLSNIAAQNLSIGTTGLTCLISASVGSGDSSKSVTPKEFGALTVSPKSLLVDIRQSAISSSAIAATIALPAFGFAGDAVIDLGLSGISISCVPTSTSTLSAFGIVEVSVAWLKCTLREGDSTEVTLGGQVRLVLPQIAEDIPAFAVDSLRIDSAGTLSVQGGWIDLPSAFVVAFCGFNFTITKFGMECGSGTEQWVGLAGTVDLGDDIPACASAEGLRFTWKPNPNGGIPDVSVSFEGIGVKFTVPGVFSFDGKVSYRKKDGNDEFAGAIQIQLISLNVTVAGQVVFGQHNGSKYMAVYLGADLPSAIPFFSTGLGIYGFSGLTALNFAPNKPPGIPWYSGDPSIPDWFHKPKVGIQDLTKWTPKSPSFALGAGITLGTLQDNGKAFSGKFLLVITLPGPVVLLQGMANIMKPRTELDKEADFKALAVLDVPAGIVQFGLDAKYAYKENGALLKIAGSAETMFHLDDASSWYVHVGKDKPASARIQAQILSLFSANAYLMIDMDHATGFRIRTGAWAGFKKEWSFKVVSIKLEASVDGNVLMSLSPPQFHGDMTLQASASVKAFGVGIGLGVHAALKVDVMDPFKVTGDLSVSTELPWPLGKWSKTMKVTWAKPAAAKIQSDDGAKPVAGGDGSTDWPPIALPLKDAAIGHHNVAVAWPLTRTAVAPGAAGLISPNYEVKPGFRCAEEPTAVSGVVALDLLPVVPVDSRIEMNFSRSVSVAGTWAKGFGKPASDGIDLIGDPSAKEKANVVVHHELAGLELEVWDGADWLTVAESGPGLQAQWQDVGLDSDGKTVQTKLWVGADTPYDFMTPALDGSAQAKLSSKGPDLLGVFSTELPKIHGGNRTRPRSSAKGASAKRSPLEPVQPPIAQPVLYTLGQAAIAWPPTDDGTAIDGKPARHVSFGDVEVTWVAGKTDPEVVTSQRTPVLAQRGGTVQFSKKLMFHADKAGRDLWCVDVLMPNHLNGGVVVFMEGSALVTAFNASDGQLADILWSSPAPQLNLTMPNIARIRFQSAKEFSLLGFKVLPS